MSENLRLLFVGDVHVSDKAPSTRTESYRDDILRKLIEIGDMSVEADGVVFVGDIFHSKQPRNTSHQTVQAVCRILQSYECPVYIVPGNHDYAAKNHSSLSRHPLGTVALMPNVHLFGTAEHRYLDLGDVLLWGVREEEAMAAFDIDGINAKDVIVVAHYAIFPPGGAPTVWQATDAREIAGQYSLTGKPILTWYGHIHEPHGTYEVDENEFANFGAISRGSLHEDGALDRSPAVGLVELGADGSRTITQVFLESARPAAEVFRITEVEEERSGASETNAFVEALSAAEVEVFSVETAISALSQHPGAPQPVRDRAVELVREVSG